MKANTSLRCAAAGALLAAVGLGACTKVAYVPIRPSTTTASASAIRVFAGRDAGRPYEALGYVYFWPGAKGDGLRDLDDEVQEFDASGSDYARFLRLAASHGADAVVDLQIVPVLNGWGTPIAFSLTGLAVRFTDEAPGAPAPEAAPAPPAAPAEQASARETVQTCAEHSDCPAGMYCGPGGRCRQP
jgi:hypothetical protein